MEPAEPPERALTLRAMEQIRFLRRAFPEEWPAGRLAQGFGVTREVIRRVLKSRFCPSAERGLKQDARAGARPNPAPAGGAAPGALSLPPAPELHPDCGRRRRPPPGTPRRGAFGSGGQAARGSPWLSGERSGAAEPGERGNRGGAS
ncbi:neugrin [Pantherophis guttatus]|uniref:Neugrin n=1 Tax=Pantherophis guttatus TaxID=94885 RepID=A0A6P9D878_PANGU|nr:neugrin [Pantherophis guttatus]